MSAQQRWEKVAELFAELSTLARDQREAFMQEACGDDEGLRNELTSLLHAHEAASGPLDRPPAVAAADTSAIEVPQAGRQVGPYRLVRPVGEGGMGSVWLAERTDGMLKRTVALKRPHVSWVGTLGERMARERDILASLEHASIARLYDAGVTAEGEPYLALEYIDGVPINAYCDSLRLPVRSRLELFLQVLDAVRYAHVHLVIHRDIKPSNILVSGDGRVHLLDFGIAKLLEVGAADDGRTQWGFAATPDYASPEQISGQAVSTASDVYSLGVLLAELLTGSRPYEIKGASRRDVEDAILQAEPRAPSRNVPPEAAQARGVSLAAITRELRGDLDCIVLKALHKDPKGRYVTVDLFAHDILRYLRGEAVQARPGTAWYYARKFFQRHKLAVTSAGAVVVALVAGAAVALWQAHLARLETARAEQVKNFALSIFEDADTDAGAGADTTAVELLQAARERVETELSGRPAIAAELMTAIGYGLIGHDRSAEAAPLLQRAIQLSSQTNGPDDARTLAAQVIYGEALYKLGQLDEAIALLRPAAERAHRINEHHAEIDAWRWVSLAQFDKADFDAAITSARAAVAALPPTPPTDRRTLLDAMQAHLALANAFAGARRDGVVEEARTVLQLAEHWPGTRAPTQTIEARVLLGYGLIVVAGQVAAGLSEVKTAYAEARRRYGEGHEQTALIANNLGLVCMEAGDIAGALAAYQAAFDSAMERPNERGPHALGLANYGLAIALDAARERERALPYFAEAARLFAEANGATTPLALRSRSARALALARLGRLDEAERSFSSLAAMPFAGAEKARHDGRLAVLRSLQGRHDEAVALATSSAAALKTFPSKTAQAQSLASLGVVLFDAGRPEQAIAPLERSIELYREAQPEESRDRADAIAALARARATQPGTQ